MSANATDERLFFQAAIGGSLRVALTIASAQTSDAQGALPPGKYLVQFLGLTGVAWIRANKFVPGETITAVVPGVIPAPGDRVNEFPIDPAIARSFTLHVRNGINDRIAAILSAGTATMIITKLGE